MNQSFEGGLFQEMATTPTTLEASRYCDLMSVFPDHASQLRDVQQAYLLAPMEGQLLEIPDSAISRKNVYKSFPSID